MTAEWLLDVHRDVGIRLAERHLWESVVLDVCDLIGECRIGIEWVAMELGRRVTGLAGNRGELAVQPFRERRLFVECLRLTVLHHLIPVLVVDREDDGVARAAQPGIPDGVAYHRRDADRAEHWVGDYIGVLRIDLVRGSNIEIPGKGRVGGLLVRRIAESLVGDVVTYAA